MKCYNCRKPTKQLFCKVCREARDSGTLVVSGPSVLKIYDTI